MSWPKLFSKPTFPLLSLVYNALQMKLMIMSGRDQKSAFVFKNISIPLCDLCFLVFWSVSPLWSLVCQRRLLLSACSSCYYVEEHCARYTTHPPPPISRPFPHLFLSFSSPSPLLALSILHFTNSLRWSVIYRSAGRQMGRLFEWWEWASLYSSVWHRIDRQMSGSPGTLSSQQAKCDVIITLQPVLPAGFE